MAERKQELLDALIAYLAKHGLADLSLRPMAAATGTSARLLIFHFGSKEKLVQEVLEEMQSRVRGSFGELMEAEQRARSGPLLRVFWDWALTRENYTHLSLLYQLHVLAAQAPRTYGRYLKKNALGWLTLIQEALPPTHRDPAFATLLGAVFDGLFIEVMSTGDKRRATEALDRFIELARASLPPAPKKASRR
jgi:AcrR family transcriptional regulator